MRTGWLLPEPWSMLLTSGAAARSRLDPDAPATFPATGAPSVALPAEATHISIGPRREPLPPQGGAFDLGGGRLRVFNLPSSTQNDAGGDLALSTSEELSFRVDGRLVAIALQQTGCIGRPTPRSPQAARGHILQDFIDWQVGCYQELLDPGFAPTNLDSTAVGAARRGWGASQAAWLRIGDIERDPARMALIVRLSRDKELARTLEALCRAPRRILERYRGKEQLARVQQLDAGCLRWYARQPGRTSPEKAGSRQELLAVRRREAFDTLENRVLKWVVEECVLLSTRYLAENHRHRRESLRCQDVSGFRERLKGLIRTGPLASLSSRLPHPVQPNYQLQQSAVYRIVWSTYVLLLGERRIQDDAWRWQRVLWKESCQQIFSACLTAPDSPARPVWPQGTVYMRMESEAGRWTEPPSAPGPFALADGRLLHLIDPREGRPPPHWCPWLDPLGGDIGLVTSSEDGDIQRGCVTWFHQDWSPDADLAQIVGRSAEAIHRAQQQAELAGLSTVPLNGLLLLNGEAGSLHVELDQTDVPGGAGQVFAMRLPPDLHEWTSDVQAGVQLLLEQLTARTVR